MEEAQKEPLIKRIFKSKITFVVIGALIVIPLAIAGFAQVQKNGETPTSDVLAANEANDILESVGRLMELPNEEPTIATVSDVEKLTDQQFFAKAQNGDKVIIFPNSQKAILYRPATDKIIEIALYTPPTNAPEQEGGIVPEPSPRSLQDLIGDDPSPTPTPEPSEAPEEEVISPSPAEEQ